MLISQAILFFTALLLVALLVEPLAHSLRIPFNIILIMLGYAGSEIVTTVFALDIGIRWYNFQFIIFHIFLPVLIFQSAIRMDLVALRKDIATIFLLSLPFMLVAALVTASILYLLIGHPAGFPWVVALLAGVLLSATDPAEIVAALEKAGVSSRLKILLEGESLFNDATAVVFFSLLLALATGSEDMITWQSGVSRFMVVFTGGITVGALVGILAAMLLKLTKEPLVHLLLSFLVAYGVYVLANDIFRVSGVMAVLAAGLATGRTGQDKGRSRQIMDSVWAFTAHKTSVLIYLFAGVTITLSMFREQWLAMLIGIFAVTAARAFMVFALLPIFSGLPKIEHLATGDRLVLGWGGVRGTVTVALALSLPLTLDAWFTVQSLVYGVVLFTLIFQAGTIRFLIDRLRLAGPDARPA